MKQVLTPLAPDPVGHYSQAVVHQNLVYISGQLPVNPGTTDKHIGSIEEQTEQTLKNLSQILTAAGSSLDRVIKTTVYISDIGLWAKVNKVYAGVFGEHRPARTVVPTSELHGGYQVEIDAIAAVGD